MTAKILLRMLSVAILLGSFPNLYASTKREKSNLIYKRETSSDVNGDSKSTVCMPMMFGKQMTPEIKKEIKTFQLGFKDTKKFPKVKLSAQQSSWLLSLSTSSSTRLSHGKAGMSRLKNPNIPKHIHYIPAPMRIRKEYRQLTNEERQSYHTALNVLKSFYPDPKHDPDTSGYDLLVKMHRYQNAPAAHGGAAFLPWHREFLLRMENALFDSGYTGPGLPYWDSSLDQSLPYPSDTIFFSDEYMGNNYGQVTSGPAANWTTIPDCQGPDNFLWRRMVTGSSGQYALFSDERIQSSVFNQTSMKKITCYGNCDFEYDHGGPHVSVSGHMGSVSCSPNDPIFFMHHAFVDCLWEIFRQNHQRTDRQLEYPSDAAHDDSIGGSHHEWDSPMEPFEGIINAQGLSDHYTNYYYQYGERPGRCIAAHQCGSDALWCDRRACRCRSKVRIGGHCGRLPHMACGGTCENGKSPKCRGETCVC